MMDNENYYILKIDELEADNTKLVEVSARLLNENAKLRAVVGLLPNRKVLGHHVCRDAPSLTSEQHTQVLTTVMGFIGLALAELDEEEV